MILVKFCGVCVCVCAGAGLTYQLRWQRVTDNVMLGEFRDHHINSQLDLWEGTVTHWLEVA